MTLEQWLEDGKADAYRRKLPELAELLEGLAKATAALRAADWDEDSARDTHATVDLPAHDSRTA
jgi:hypothetical protein